VLPIGALTKGGQGEQLAEIGSMRDAGARAVGDADRTVADAALMRRALRYADSFRLTVIAHCEDESLSAGGDIHEGRRATALGLNGIPVSAETTILARDLILCRETGRSAAYRPPLQRRRRGFDSSGQAARLAGDGRGRRASLAADVDDLPPYDSNYKVRPPFREASDRDELIAACADGTIDAVVSDHAPHTGNVKMQEFDSCPFGVIALGTTVSVALEALVRSGRTSLARLIELFTSGPAAALGLEQTVACRKGPLPI
jgi:dihydroorotase